MVLNVPESFHLLMLAIACPSSGIALFSGRARHGRDWPLAVGIGGLLFLGIAMLFFEGEGLELYLTVAGSLGLAGAHLANWRSRHALHKH